MFHKLGSISRLIMVMAGFFFCLKATGQPFALGSNGTNVPETLTPQVIDSLVAIIPANTPYALRIRADKDLITTASLQNIYAFETELNKKDRWLSVIFTFNTRAAGGPNNDYQLFEQILSYPLQIDLVECGNEEYGKVAGHASATQYLNTYVQPIAAGVLQRGYYGPVGLSLAPEFGTRQDHINWNNTLIPAINANPVFQPVLHLYYDKNQVPALSQLNRDKLPQSNDNEMFFGQIAQQALASGYLVETMQYFIGRLPGKYFYITELGLLISTGNLSNTYGYEISRLYALDVLSRLYPGVIKAVCIHNGPNNTNTGFISEKKRQDVGNGPYIMRTGYYVLNMFWNRPPGSVFTYNQPGKQGMFLNFDRTNSSAGWCEWWPQGNLAVRELKGISNVSGPAYSFGYAYAENTDCDTTTVVTVRDTVIYTLQFVSDTTWYDGCKDAFEAGPGIRSLFWKWKTCKLLGWYAVEKYWDTVPVTVQVKDTALVVQCDTATDPPPPTPDCTGITGTDPQAAPCKRGQNDDYLHPERFIAPDGSLYCDSGIVIFDHSITVKFLNTIIPWVKDSTGITINLQQIDFYITLPETGEQVIYKDIFNWCENGKRTIFNTNVLLMQQWPEYLQGKRMHTFGVKMIHRPTGVDISIVFKDHTTMDLLFTGL